MCVCDFKQKVFYKISILHLFVCFCNSIIFRVVMLYADVFSCSVFKEIPLTLKIFIQLKFVFIEVIRT